MILLHEGRYFITVTQTSKVSRSVSTLLERNLHCTTSMYRKRASIILRLDVPFYFLLSLEGFQFLHLPLFRVSSLPERVRTWMMHSLFLGSYQDQPACNKNRFGLLQWFIPHRHALLGLLSTRRYCSEIYSDLTVFRLFL